MQISGEFRDLAAACLLSTLLFAAAALVPLIGPPAGFFSAAPLIWLAARHGDRAALLGVALAVAMLLPALPPPLALIFLLEHAAPAWYLGRRIRAAKGIVAGSAVAAVAVTALMTGATFYFAARGQDPVQVLEQQLRAGLAEFGGTGADPSAALGESFEQVLSFVRRVLPAITLIGVFLECALSSLLAVRVLARSGAAPRSPTLTRFALPEWLIWVLIPVLALCWAPQPRLATPALNLLLPLLFAYLLQGLSISLHLADRVKLSRLPRTMLVFSLAFFPWLLALPLLLGLLDFRFSFRQRWPLG